MNQMVASTISGVVALVATLLVSYWVWLRQRSANASPQHIRFFSGLPLLVGLAAALFLMAILSRVLASGDRFFSPASAVRLFAALLVSLSFVILPGLLGRRSWLIALAFQVVAAAIAVAGGVRFDVLKFFSVPLGAWGIPLTIVWLIVATGVVRLLDGIDGGAPLLLLATAMVVLISSITNTEYVLAGFSATVVGAVLGGLRFHLAPARLPLRGPSASLFGFTFAVLTVLARQKTETALLIMLPLALIIILVAGATLTFLERGLVPGAETDSSKEDNEPRS